MKRVTIIGGGASGTLTAVNLIKHAGTEKIRVDLVEDRARLGRGVAYGTTLSEHLLNVPAGRMGAFPDDPSHFHRWLAGRGYSHSAEAFVPRKIFGEYLSTLLDEAAALAHASGSTLDVYDDEATDIHTDESGCVVRMASGSKLLSDKVVLAFGNFPPPDPFVADMAYTSADKYFRDPWNSRVYREIADGDDILIVGTGLSMIDVVLRYERIGHSGRIFAISTRGLLPAVHKACPGYPSFADELEGLTRITDVVRVVRRHISEAAALGIDWRAVIDSLRPVTQTIWQRLPIAEKRYFKQHLSRHWNIARHRMPPEAAAVIDRLRADGKLTILSGRLKRIDRSNGRFAVSFSDRGRYEALTVDAIINCIGSETDFSKVASRLVRRLIAADTIRCDELRMGLDATPDGRLIGPDGRPSERLSTLGTSLKGILWESTAMPEIRSQANALALRLLAE
ncbi:MAG: FAD/NAD(P)-binding protein [Acidobacteria bacterium]|nr:FAD/NAD(P)-binding protein [Acidobacteriota bacterium]MCW5948742.1 FAD/NAD(P)-binding protein [Pyrinomonadaceae bacterium]